LPSGEYTDPVAKDLQICIREARGRRVHSWLLPYKWQGAPRRYPVTVPFIVGIP